jgi:hypothetical protein
MDEQTKELIEGAHATYENVLVGKDSRIQRGAVLWTLFESAVDGCRADREGSERQLAERINELAVAKILAEDKGLRGPISYEPNLLPSGRKIDFVADRLRDNVYIEVNTVHPEIADTEEAWKNYVERSKHHPKHANFVVHKDWMGGQLYDNTFASRSRFLEYTLDFEPRLAEAKQVREGPGLLVFCGNGVRWHRSNLEDFADYYYSRRHRQDDPFALMEKHHIETEKLQFLHNVDNFGCVRRPIEQALSSSFTRCEAHTSAASSDDDRPTSFGPSVEACRPAASPCPGQATAAKARHVPGLPSRRRDKALVSGSRWNVRLSSKSSAKASASSSTRKRRRIRRPRQAARRAARNPQVGTVRQPRGVGKRRSVRFCVVGDLREHKRRTSDKFEGSDSASRRHPVPLIRVDCEIADDRL